MLRPAARERLVATLREWLDHQGRVDDTARALGVHPQTVRYRLAQLRETFGAALDDAGRPLRAGARAAGARPRHEGAAARRREGARAKARRRAGARLDARRRRG